MACNFSISRFFATLILKSDWPIYEKQYQYSLLRSILDKVLSATKKILSSSVQCQVMTGNTFNFLFEGGLVGGLDG